MDIPAIIIANIRYINSFIFVLRHYYLRIIVSIQHHTRTTITACPQNGNISIPAILATAGYAYSFHLSRDESYQAADDAEVEVKPNADALVKIKHGVEDNTAPNTSLYVD